MQIGGGGLNERAVLLDILIDLLNFLLLFHYHLAFSMSLTSACVPCLPQLFGAGQWRKLSNYSIA